MAANDYYHGQQHQRPPYDDDGPTTSAPFYPPQQVPSPQPTPAPSYHTNYAAPAPAYTPSPVSQHQQPLPQPPQRPGQENETSPFDTVFDDHVYPANSPPQGAGAGSANMSQQAFNQDTTYYGGHAESSNAIPLQDHPNKDVEMNDHVYDAPQGAAAPGAQRPKKKGGVRFGELGMIGADSKRIPWVVYLFTAVQVGVFVGEIIRNATLTGSPIMIKPQFNPMIGPSSAVMINMGARYTPCMKNVKEIQGASASRPVGFLCPNATSDDSFCPLSTLCGFGGVPNPEWGNAEQKPEPNQWFRFIIPIFMHAGIIHIVFNLVVQWIIGKEMERAIGSIRFFLVYMSAGIFGNVMGGLYAPVAVASTGASGALFGIIALLLIDLLYSWKERRSPFKDLILIIVNMVIAFVLGLLPGLDNFCHIGGFVMGLALGIAVLHSPNSLRRKMGDGLAYSAVSPTTGPTPPPFIKNPVGFFKGRKPLWWVWWLVRAGMVIMITVVFIVLLNKFYQHVDDCHWCRYLSCIPIKNWCDLGALPGN